MRTPQPRIPGGHRAARHPRARRVVLAAVGTLAAGTVGVLALDFAGDSAGNARTADSDVRADSLPAGGSASASDSATTRSARPTESASPTATASPSPTTSSASPKASATTPTATAPRDTTEKKAAPGPAPAPVKPAGKPRKPAPADPVPPPSGAVAQVISLVNAERRQAGCGDLTANAKLTSAAQSYTGVMARSGELSHTGPDGSTMSGRISATGYKWSATGENIARGQANATEVMDSWMKSPGHRANILNCNFTEIGVGVVQGGGGPWWTQDFARPQ
ncbi:CAP domain-containing protein [Streptomyces sp. NBC_00513]|uniref:CAP domain-containing protein n=1 Tax=unclassified Streptomyces TaxID=2593676 RepID=UPI00225063CA|nr:CAP domain-containing protein [Streptomyces sp. NBC_00424]MCX5071783.1 CAP domain-containing protein [Streptomyces sp. NBC_00424]WUD44837.1 CAP domain-containing protein [Streptomyces sp. NBC_00513]